MIMGEDTRSAEEEDGRRPGAIARLWAFVGRMGTLRMRTALTLGIATLPIGLIGIWQAGLLHDETRALRERALIGAAVARATREGTSIAVARGALEAASATVNLSAPNCADALREVVEASESFVFMGLTHSDGRLTCRSDGGEDVDLSGRQSFIEAISDPRPSVTALDTGAATGIPVLVVTEPISLDGEIAFLSISLSLAAVERFDESADAGNVARGVLVAGDGKVVAAAGSSGDQAPVSPLPLDPSPEAPVAFSGRDATGARRAYALAPIAPGELYELAWWADGRSDDAALTWRRSASIGFPALMWLAAMATGAVAVNRFVNQHVERLRRDLRRFGAGDRRFDPLPYRAGAAEIAEVGDAFGRMVAATARQEAAATRHLAEKDMLLREVHHRVQNNLQLIVSIVNAQLRAEEPARGRGRDLRDLRARILMGLAAVHHQLDLDDDLSMVDASALVRDVTARAADAAPSVLVTSEDDGPAPILRDEALPLAMIVTEALIAADCAEESDRRQVMISVSSSEGRVSVDIDAPDDDEARTSAGARLTAAFVRQIGGDAASMQSDSGAPGGSRRKRLRVTFASPTEAAQDGT